MPLELRRTDRGIKYLSGVRSVDLMRFRDGCLPVCDECFIGLMGSNDIFIIPLLGSVYCSRCISTKLENLSLHPEDSSIQDRKVKYYAHSLIRSF